MPPKRLVESGSDAAEAPKPPKRRVALPTIKSAKDLKVGDWCEYTKRKDYGGYFGEVVDVRHGVAGSETDWLRVQDCGNVGGVIRDEWVFRAKCRFQIRGLYKNNVHIQAAGGYKPFGE